MIVQNLRAPLTEAEERPIDRAIMQEQIRDEWLSSDTLISQVDRLQEERRDLWKQVDELRAELRRVQALAVAYGAPAEAVA